MTVEVESIVSSASPENLNKNISKTLKALIDYEQKSATSKKTSNGKKNLLELDDDGDNDASSSATDKMQFYVMFGLKKIPAEAKVKPQIIAVPNPWKSAGSADGVSVCVFTKDPHEEVKKKIKALRLPSITKIMPVSKLRKNFKPFEAKRQLCASYDVFLTDCRVVALLPKLLGKKFFNTKKIPIVVNLTKEGDSLKEELETAINSTYLHLTTGPCSTVKIGLGGQGIQELTENGLEIIKQVVEKIPGGWDNIKSLHLTSIDSLALPIYNAKVE